MAIDHHHETALTGLPEATGEAAISFMPVQPAPPETETIIGGPYPILDESGNARPEAGVAAQFTSAERTDADRFADNVKDAAPGSSHDKLLRRAKYAGLMGVAALTAIHFGGEDFGLSWLAGNKAPEGIFGGLRQIAWTLGIGGVGFAEGYVMSRLANKLPAVQEAIGKLAEGKDLATRGEKIGHVVMKGLDVARTPLIWTAKKASKLSNRLEKNENPAVRAMGRMLYTLALSNIEGTPGATTVEKALTLPDGTLRYPEEQGGVTRKRSAQIAGAFMGSWLVFDNAIVGANKYGGTKVHDALHAASTFMGGAPGYALAGLIALPLAAATTIAVHYGIKKQSDKGEAPVADTPGAPSLNPIPYGA